MLARCADELRESLTPDDIDLVLASAVLADRELLRAVHAIPAMHAAMGPWRN
jgi:propionyl-CoA carboxylase alpha chain/3-methylcrotonyl-CoA carboxylase alpha subunit/acetyl-CoA/propionyl-CoA carboxylase biotin carboxyl carrier protein